MQVDPQCPVRPVAVGVVRYNGLYQAGPEWRQQPSSDASDRIRLQRNPSLPARADRGAVVAAGRNLSQPYEAWIAADIPRGAVRVMITGPQGFDRTVTFDLAEDPAVITQRIRETIED